MTMLLSLTLGLSVCAAPAKPVNRPAAELLEKRLQSKDPGERRIALIGLIGIADASTVESLKRVMNDDQAENSRLAAIALSKVGEDTEPVCKLVVDWLKSQKNLRGEWTRYYGPDCECCPVRPVNLMKAVAAAINSDRALRYHDVMFDFYCWIHGPLDDVIDALVSLLPRYGNAKEYHFPIGPMLEMLVREPKAAAKALDTLKQLLGNQSNYVPGMAASIILVHEADHAASKALLLGLAAEGRNSYLSEYSNIVRSVGSMKMPLMNSFAVNAGNQKLDVHQKFQNWSAMRRLDMDDKSVVSIGTLMLESKQDYQRTRTMSAFLKHHTEPWPIVETVFLKMLDSNIKDPTVEAASVLRDCKELPEKYHAAVRAGLVNDDRIERARYAVECVRLMNDPTADAWLKRQLHNRNVEPEPGKQPWENCRVRILQGLRENPSLAARYREQILALLANSDETVVETAATVWYAINKPR